MTPAAGAARVRERRGRARDENKRRPRAGRSAGTRAERGTNARLLQTCTARPTRGFFGVRQNDVCASEECEGL
eukprot:4730337-Prymnesium_polylepis.1